MPPRKRIDPAGDPAAKKAPAKKVPAKKAPARKASAAKPSADHAGVDNPGVDNPGLVPSDTLGATSPVPATTKTAPAPTADLPYELMERLVGGAYYDPHGLLGAHPAGDKVVVRTLRPDAVSVSVLLDGGQERVELTRLHPGGIFGAVLDRSAVPDYRVEVTYQDISVVVDEPYRFLPSLGEMDLHLIGEGRHEKLWTVPRRASTRVRRHDRSFLCGVGAKCARCTGRR